MSGPIARRPLQIALVNNMPDAALTETEEQFLRLLAAGRGPAPQVSLYRLDSITRSDEARARVADRYQPVAALYAGDAPDAVVITGNEPSAVTLRAEPYWSALEELLRWAGTHTRSMLLSCLAAHAAMDALHDAPRRRLPTKLTGVIEQPVLRAHPVVVGMGATVAFPHSRLNEVPSGALTDAGYELVVGDETNGWTIATMDSAQCLVVLVQGHPEYSADSLLREYRRDVRRFLTGEFDSAPTLPVGYVDSWSHQTLTDYVAHAPRLAPRGVMEGFPFAAVAARLSHSWAPLARLLFANWLAEVSERAEEADRVRQVVRAEYPDDVAVAGRHA